MARAPELDPVERAICINAVLTAARDTLGRPITPPHDIGRCLLCQSELIERSRACRGGEFVLRFHETEGFADG